MVTHRCNLKQPLTNRGETFRQVLRSQQQKRDKKWVEKFVGEVELAVIKGKTKAAIDKKY